MLNVRSKVVGRSAIVALVFLARCRRELRSAVLVDFRGDVQRWA